MAPFSVIFSGPPCEGGGGGWGSGFGVKGVGTVAPRAGGQCAEKKTPRKDRQRAGKVLRRFCAWCSVPRHVGLAHVDFAMPGLRKFFSTIWKFEFRAPIHHSDFNLGGGGGGYSPLSTPNAYTTDIFFIHHSFSTDFHLSIFCPYRQIFV